MASYSLRLNHQAPAATMQLPHHHQAGTGCNFFGPTNGVPTGQPGHNDLLAVNTYLERLPYQPAEMDKLASFYNNNNNSVQQQHHHHQMVMAPVGQRPDHAAVQQQGDYFIPYFGAGQQQQQQHAVQQPDCNGWPASTGAAATSVPYDNSASIAAGIVADYTLLKRFSVRQLIQQHHHHQLEQTAAVQQQQQSNGPAGTAASSISPAHDVNRVSSAADLMVTAGPAGRDDSETSSHATDKSDGE